MVRVIAFPKRDPAGLDTDELTLRWSGRVSLTTRILTLNIVALALLAGGFFYLDSYRSRLIDSRTAQASREVRLVARTLSAVGPADRTAMALTLARDTGARLRLYDPLGGLKLDTRAMGLRNVVLADPDKEAWSRGAARVLDAMIDTVVGASRAPLYRERKAGTEWPVVVAARANGATPTQVWRAPDRTPIITAAAALDDGAVVMTTGNARDITQTVRLERFRLSIVLLIVTSITVLLSLFLARTIVRPLQRLARAAVRVRLGRAREVVVPRLPSRRDEIGSLARALSDMSQALRARIDATEAFAADVTHEMKNPLASLRSAVDGLSRVKDPELQERLLAIVQDDVHRLDRLISDISEASRLDAQLSRAKFEPVDLPEMAAALIAGRETRGVERGVRLELERRAVGEPLVLGEAARLERVIENLLDNAVSFSPDGGVVTTRIESADDCLTLSVEDEGPGVPEAAREAVFHRFHSIRPEGEEFGRHSGLGLAIARTIVEGHGGRIAVRSRADGRPGAQFLAVLPLAGRH